MSSKNFCAKIETLFFKKKMKCLTWDNRTMREMTQLFFLLDACLSENLRGEKITRCTDWLQLFRLFFFISSNKLFGFFLPVYLRCIYLLLSFLVTVVWMLGASITSLKGKKRTIFSFCVTYKKGNNKSTDNVGEQLIPKVKHVKIFFVCVSFRYKTREVSRWDISAVYPFRDVWLFVVSKINQPINDMQHISCWNVVCKSHDATTTIPG